jgi:hypothetical protein
MKTDKKACPKCNSKVIYFNRLFRGEGEECSINSKHYKVLYPNAY